MLPDIHLDQITFEEMLEKAKNRIAGCYPEWTDFNYHDPGITLVELFAWLKEIQQYELNHVGDAHRQKYLKLLGTEVRHRTGAEAFVCAKVKEPVRVPAGSRLEALGVPFETEELQVLPGVSIVCAFGLTDRKVSFLNQEQLALGHTLEFYPFGREALSGTGFFLGFSGPLPVGETLHLTCWVGGNQEIPRNPVEPDTIPLAKLRCTFWNGECYQPLEILKDETFGFLFDGQMTFRLPGEMKERKVDGESGYFLRMELKESQYEMPPVLSFLDINTLKVRQKETAAIFLEAAKELTGEEDAKEQLLTISHGLCEKGRIQVFYCEEERYREIAVQEVRQDAEQARTHIRVEVSWEDFRKGCFYVLVSRQEDWYQSHQILGTGRGFPNEEFGLDEALVEDLELLVEEPEHPGSYQKWEMRKDFAHSGAEDCHYCVDSVNGRVLFGDCIHGMAPEGKILLVSYRRVLGEDGNVKAAKIDCFVEEKFSSISVTNPHDAVGGQEEESISQAFSRVRKELTESRNMVTAEDYEQAVKKTPGLRIESCKALVGGTEHDDRGAGKEILLVVKPFSPDARPRLKPALVENIRQYLEPRRMLGVGLRILSPVYGKISVYLEVTTRPQYQGAQARIEQAVEEYIKPFKKEFGGQISYSGLYGCIDRLDCVVGIRSLVMDAKGNGMRKNVYGDLLFPGNGIVDEIEIHCSCSVEE